MPFWYRKALNLTEKEIRYAMSHTDSNKGAARFLGIDRLTYRKYAKMYTDSETGKTLWELHHGEHKSRPRPGAGRFTSPKFFQEVLEGKHPEYKGYGFKKRLIDLGLFAEECQQCGFHERRVDDLTVPLVLIWKDGNKRNHLKENLIFLCFNCYYLMYADYNKGNMKKIKFNAAD